MESIRQAWRVTTKSGLSPSRFWQNHQSFRLIHTLSKHTTLLTYSSNLRLSGFEKKLSYAVPSKSSQTFLYRHLKLSWTLEKSVCYCYTSYKITDQVLWFQVQMNSYNRNWNTPYKSLIVTAGEFQKCNQDVRTL